MAAIVRVDSKFSFVAWHDARDQIKRRVSVPEVLRDLRVKFRGRKRCDCPFSKGSQPGTLSFTDDLWNCFRCAEEPRAGDVFTLVERAHNCSFMNALKYLAEIAHIDLPTGKKLSPAERERLDREEAERKSVSTSAGELDSAERSLRLWYCAVIHRCEQKQDEVRRRMRQLHSGAGERWNGEFDGCGSWLAALVPLLRSYLAGYTLLSFGSARDRAHFVLRPQMRHELIHRVLQSGGCFSTTPNGWKWRCWSER